LIANQSANWAEWNDELLKLELEDLKNLNFDLDLTGFDLSEVERLLRNNDAQEDDFEETIPGLGLFRNEQFLRKRSRE
jgi:hypothetical protein